MIQSTISMRSTETGSKRGREAATESLASAHISSALRSWAAAEYRDFPYVHYGLSGASLMFEALRQENRQTILLPAFICPTLSAMALQTGMKVIHIDVDRTTLHPTPDMLSQCLVERDAAQTVLLLDHTFGYPVPDISQWRRRHPDLLIIEDCVRALGGEVHGKPVGHEGDWALFSMYKNTLGNDHGAVLLTRSPYAIRSGPPPATTCLQWASGVRPLRSVYDAMKRLRPDFGNMRRDLNAPSWSAAIGVPNQLCQLRFANQLTSLTDARIKRCLAGDAIQEALRDVEPIQFIRPMSGCRTAGFFLSFSLADGVRRDSLLETLHKQGLFLIRAWNVVPAFYRCFAKTFPYGATDSVFLADRICHIPLWQYLTPRRQAQLVMGLRKAIPRCRTATIIGNSAPKALQSDRDHSRTRSDRYDVCILRTTEAIVAFLDDWQAFTSAPVTGLNVFNDLFNVAAEAKHLNREVCVFVVRRGGAVECVAPMYLDRSGFKLQLSVLTLAKLRARQLRVFGDQFIFAQSSTPEDCLSAIFSSLLTICGEFDFMFLLNLPATSPLWLHRRRIPRFADGWQFMVASPRMESVHRIVLPDNYKAYLASLSKNTRKSIRKSIRDLVKDPRTQLIRMTRPEHVPDYLLMCNEVERQSWQGKTFGHSTWDSPANREYFAHMARLGWLRSYVLLYNGQPIAFEHGFQYLRTYFGAATAYDQNYQRLGAGAVLMQRVIEDLITIEPQRVFDFGFGDAEYKRSLSNSTNESASIYLVPRNRWRRLIGIQSTLTWLDENMRNVLIKLKLDERVRRWLKRKQSSQRTEPNDE